MKETSKKDENLKTFRLNDYVLTIDELTDEMIAQNFQKNNDKVNVDSDYENKVYVMSKKQSEISIFFKLKVFPTY